MTQCPTPGIRIWALGLRRPCRHARRGRKKAVLVVISDGETDLPGRTDRTETESEADLARCGEICAEENIPIYGVAFGQYEGSGDSLVDLAALTGGKTYKVTQPAI